MCSAVPVAISSVHFPLFPPFYSKLRSAFVLLTTSYALLPCSASISRCAVLFKLQNLESCCSYCVVVWLLYYVIYVAYHIRLQVLFGVISRVCVEQLMLRCLQQKAQPPLHTITVHYTTLHQTLLAQKHMTTWHLQQHQLPSLVTPFVTTCSVSTTN